MQVKSGIEAFVSIYKRLDVLVLNAGISHFGLLDDVSEEEYEAVMRTNLKGAYNCVKAAAPYMTGAGKGSIVAVSSVWGETGASCEAVYSASKAGVVGLVKDLAKEYALAGVRVNCVSPGFVGTEMNDRLSEKEREEFLEQIPMNRAGSPEEIARAVAFLAGDDSSYITGQVLSVNGGLYI